MIYVYTHQKNMTHYDMYAAYLVYMYNYYTNQPFSPLTTCVPHATLTPTPSALLYSEMYGLR